MELIPSTPAANPVELPVPDDAQEEGEGVFDLCKIESVEIFRKRLRLSNLCINLDCCFLKSYLGYSFTSVGLTGYLTMLCLEALVSAPDELRQRSDMD